MIIVLQKTIWRPSNQIYYDVALSNAHSYSLGRFLSTVEPGFPTRSLSIPILILKQTSQPAVAPAHLHPLRLNFAYSDLQKRPLFIGCSCRVPERYDSARSFDRRPDAPCEYPVSLQL